MIIVNDKKNIMLFSEELCEINIHSDGLRIVASFSNPNKRDVYLGCYDTRTKAQRAFYSLLHAIGDEQRNVYTMLDNDSDELNTTITAFGDKGYHKTTGKTK